MDFINNGHVMAFCDRLVKVFNKNPSVRAYGKLSIARRKENINAVEVKWISGRDWFVSMEMPIKKSNTYTEESFTFLCNEIYYNVLDTLIDVFRYYCEIKSDDSHIVKGIIKEIFSNDN